MSTLKPPANPVHRDWRTPFPVTSSRIAEHLLVSDLCVPAVTRQSGWDALGHEIVVNHNHESLLRGYAAHAAHDGPGPHVVTGPIAVRGAERGDVLKVEVLDLRMRVPYGVIDHAARATCDGDLLLQLCAHSPDTVAHALRDIARATRGGIITTEST